MKLTPKSEKEVSNFKVFPKGIYDFEVITAEEKTSKAGNDMIEVRLRVFDAEGNRTTVTDYLMEAIAYKLRHAAAACGLLGSYEQGQLNADNMVGCCGKVVLAVETPVGYPEKNVVKDYISPKEGEKLPEKKSPSKELDDSIPF